MKTGAILFGCFAIYLVSMMVARAVFGEGAIGHIVGGLLGAGTFVGLMSSKDEK